MRRFFVRASGPEPPPLVRMLRGGRGGTVRLKLYLSLLWIASGEPHDAQFPARAWAELLDLNDPDTLGARRVKDAVDWLDREGFLKVERQAGRPSILFLLDDAGRRTDYAKPGTVKEVYDRLPAVFWTNGWLAVLSASAIALLLVANDQRPGWFWLSPDVARKLYGMSPDTWLRASRELESHGLISVRRSPVQRDGFGWRRVRKEYKLDMERLKSLVGAV